MMSRPGWHRPRLAAQLRSLVDRLGLGLLVGLSITLLLLGKADLRLAALASAGMGDIAAPVLGFVRGPVVAVRSAFDRVGAVLAVDEENARLREENRQLLAWQVEAARLAVQNRALQRMLKVPAVDHPATWLTARIVGDSGGSFVQALLLDGGTDQGVAVGMPATTPEGLVGRVVEVGRRSARVLLITDFNSRIPVVVESSGDHAILEGDNSLLPRLRFLPMNPGFAVGDRVLTSGRGGVLPAGLIIGRIEEAGDGKVRVRSHVDWSRLDYLSLLQTVGTPPPEAGAPPSATVSPGS
jgi:rod shape-determining protein MreC